MMKSGSYFDAIPSTPAEPNGLILPAFQTEIEISPSDISLQAA